MSFWNSCLNNYWSDLRKYSVLLSSSSGTDSKKAINYRAMALGLFLIRFDFLYRKVSQRFYQNRLKSIDFIPGTAKTKSFLESCYVDCNIFFIRRCRFIQTDYQLKRSTGYNKIVHLHWTDQCLFPSICISWKKGLERLRAIESRSLESWIWRAWD